MKLKVLNSIPTTLAFTLGITISLSSVSYAQELSFFCGTINEEPAIIAQTAQGNIPVIRWVSEDFQVLGINSRSQCENMAEKLQKDCVQPTDSSQPRAFCTIIQGGSFSAEKVLNPELGSDLYEQLPPLWGSDIQLSQSHEKVPIFPVYIHWLNGFPPTVAVPGDRNIFATPASPSSIKGEPEPERPLW
ncbi:MAG: COP23 domain-containing protein [Microcoleus sp.]